MSASYTPAALVVSLPTELLLEIFQHLDSQSLFRLAGTCHGLRHISFIQWLDRLGIAHPPGAYYIAMSDDEYAALPALAALYPNRVLRSVSFFLGVSVGSDQCMRLRAAALFVSRAASIGTATVCLPFSDEHLHTEPCFSALDAFLSSLDGKVHHSLSITGGKSWARACPNGLRLSCRPLQQLSTVCLAGNVMLHPCCIPWLIATLNASPLTTLRIDPRYHTSTAFWAALLRGLSLPELQVLELGYIGGLDLTDLCAFLIRAPSLREFKSCDNSRVCIHAEAKSSALPRTAHPFPSLTVLNACPQIVHTILRCGIGEASPRLEELVLYNQQDRLRLDGLPAFEAALARVARRKGPIELCVIISDPRHKPFTIDEMKRANRMETKMTCIHLLTLSYSHNLAFRDVNLVGRCSIHRRVIADATILARRTSLSRGSDCFQLSKASHL